MAKGNETIPAGDSAEVLAADDYRGPVAISKLAKGGGQVFLAFGDDTPADEEGIVIDDYGTVVIDEPFCRQRIRAYNNGGSDEIVTYQH